MVNWIKQNKSSVTFAGLALVFVLFCAVAQGCDLQKMIAFTPPVEVVQAIDLPEGKLTLADSAKVWTDWEYFVKSNTEALKIAVDDANQRYAFVSSLIDMGLGAASSFAPAFPGGAIVLSLLTGAAGVMVKKPGTDAVIAKEKEDSYNAGIELGKKIAEELAKKA